MDNYEKFRIILDSHIAGAPESKHFDTILRMLFSEEEIEIAIHMNFRKKGVEGIAMRSSISLSEVENRLDSMADKGIILSRKKNGMDWLNSLKMKSPGTVIIANKMVTITVKIMGVGNGVQLHRHILEFFPKFKKSKDLFHRHNFA